MNVMFGCCLCCLVAFAFFPILVFRVLLVAVAFMPSPESRYSLALWREV
mgnify:CR=1 FL=1